MNRYPLWKYLLIATVLLVGFLYALPNLYGEDPALQISSTRGAKVDASTEARIKVLLQEAGIASHGSERNPGSLLIRFGNTGGQLKAQDLVKRELGDDYIVALNLAPTTPTWLRAIGATPMYLGLDLRGGVHFQMQVDMAEVMQQTAERYVEDMRQGQRNVKIQYLAVARAIPCWCKSAGAAPVNPSPTRPRPSISATAAPRCPSPSMERARAPCRTPRRKTSASSWRSCSSRTRPRPVMKMARRGRPRSVWKR